VQLFKNFPKFCGTRRFITAFTRALHWPLSSVGSIQSILSHSISVRCIEILPPTYVLAFLFVSFLLAFPQISHMHSSYPLSCYMLCPSHSSLRHHSNCNWRRVNVMRLLICSFLQPPVTSSLFYLNILLSTLFSNIFSLCSSLNVRDKFSHPYRTTGKIKRLCILRVIFTFF
jgi:hypothetical protein